MPRIQCPSNPYCYVDCPASGYAYYVTPYGPCKTGCDQENAGDTLLNLILTAEAGATFSGILLRVSSAVLARFAQDIAESAPPESADDIATLQRLDILRNDRRHTASWDGTEVRGIIRAVADATRDGGRSGHVMTR